jgi:hypothetical protein
MMQTEDADSVRWGIWSHGAKTREANPSQGDTIRCEVAGIALRNRQPACRNLIERWIFPFQRDSSLQSQRLVDNISPCSNMRLEVAAKNAILAKPTILESLISNTRRI